MIPVSPATWQSDDDEPDSWQNQLRHAITDPATLCQHLQLPLKDQAVIELACQQFPLRVPFPYLSRIKPGNARDPLLLQVLPQSQELQKADGFSNDPLEERQHNPVPGLVHKYASRVLLITTQLCAVHCRYCFRRDFPYEDNRNSRASWQAALEYISAHPEVNEVILSGGDPLSLPDRQLAWLCNALEQIPHLTRLRLHTRLPIVIPQRVSPPLLAWISQTRFKVIVVLHCNHPQEIDGNVAIATQALQKAGVTLLNQSVLLAGVNDDSHTLVLLSEALFAISVLPYYLHQLDRLQGSQHFEVSDSRATALHQAMQTQLPGFLVPTLAREEPGAASKTRLL
jgi:EF-P beta-lysylation protein EpmB